MGKVKNLKGKRFGKLTAIEFVGIGNRHYAMWRCTCDCGNECITSADVLTRKTNHSCGWGVAGWVTHEANSIDRQYLDEFDLEHFEVIGNIFDNPELLQEERR